MSEHTATPWFAQPRDREGVCIISAGPGIPVGQTPTNGLVAVATRRFGERATVWEANASFIVRACNSHDAMLAALKAALRDLTGEDYDCPSVVTKDHSLVNQIRAAIALAEGEGRDQSLP